ANVQVSSTEPAVVPTVTLGGSHGDSGCHPENHELNVLELNPLEQEDVTPLPPVDFDAASWSIYPKGRGSKTDAKAIWQRMPPADQVAAVDALSAFLAGRDWQRGFHPAPEVW